MKVSRNKQHETNLIERMRSALSRGSADRASGLHVSDILTPMKAFWRHIKPLPLTRREVMFFATGQAHHLIIAHMLQLEGVSEKVVERDGITGTIDFFCDMPIEFKTSRIWRLPRPGKEHIDLDTYIQQITLYMAMTDSLKGQIWVNYFSIKDDIGWNTRSPDMRCYGVSLQRHELQKIWRQAVMTKKLIQVALDKQDKTLLPLCPQWQCGRWNKAKEFISTCKWFQDCQPL